MGATPPEWLSPMVLGDELNRRVLTNVDSGAIEAGDIVVIDTVNDAVSYLCAKTAMADGTYRQNGALYIAEQVAPTPSVTSRGNRGDKFWAVRSTVQTGNTSAVAKGDPVWLSDSAAGGWTLTMPTDSFKRRQIGQVLVASTSGYVLLEPSAYQKRGAAGSSGNVRALSQRVSLADLPGGAVLTTGPLVAHTGVENMPILGAAIYIHDVAAGGAATYVNISVISGVHTHCDLNVFGVGVGWRTKYTDTGEFAGFLDIVGTDELVYGVTSDAPLDDLTDFDITIVWYVADVVYTP